MRTHSLTAVIASGFIKLGAEPVAQFSLAGIDRVARRENSSVSDVVVFRLTDGLWHFFKRPNSAPFSQTALMA